MDLAKASDQVLARELMERSPRAAHIAWRRYAPMVSGILKRSLRSDDIDDVMQEVFLRVFRNAPALRSPESLRAFIVSVAIRRARYEIRQRQRQRRLDLALYLDGAGQRAVNMDTDSREALTRFTRILERKNANDRRAFVLHVIEGIDVSEIARTLKRSEPTIRRHLARSRACAARHAGRDQVLMRYVSVAEIGGGLSASQGHFSSGKKMPLMRYSESELLQTATEP